MPPRALTASIICSVRPSTYSEGSAADIRLGLGRTATSVAASSGVSSREGFPKMCWPAAPAPKIPGPNSANVQIDLENPLFGPEQFNPERQVGFSPFPDEVLSG